MSTQSNPSIPMRIVSDREQHNFRLIELPSDLLELLTSENAPILRLKSREVVDGSTKDANVVLCTPDKTYQVRQVSTSNSVFVTRPYESPSNDLLGPPRSALEAISKCSSTIELLPSAPGSAATYIRADLPIFLSTGKYSSQKSITKEQLFSDIPMSQVECEQGWNELSCFETTSPAGCFVPSAKVRTQAWQAILTTATAAGIDLTISYPGIGLPHFLTDLEVDWPSSLLIAILRTVSIRDADGDLAVDEKSCVRFVGVNLLEVQSEGRAIDASNFLRTWRDAVPEKWRESCVFAVLQGYCTLSDDRKSVTFTSNDSSAHPGDTAIAAKTAAGNKRKWHEKFRPTKKS